MEANEQNKEQNVEEMDVIKQLTEIMGQQGMGEQSQDFVEVLRYIAGMQLQLGAMVDELQGVREQLAKMPGEPAEGGQQQAVGAGVTPSGKNRRFSRTSVSFERPFD